MQGFPRILFQLKSSDSNVPFVDVKALCVVSGFWYGNVEGTLAGNARFLLGDLVTQGHVGVKVMFSFESGKGMDLCSKGQRGTNGLVDTFSVQDGQRARGCGVEKRYLSVGVVQTELRRGTGEEFGACEKLGVDFNAYAHLPMLARGGGLNGGVEGGEMAPREKLPQSVRHVHGWLL